MQAGQTGPETRSCGGGSTRKRIPLRETAEKKHSGKGHETDNRGHAGARENDTRHPSTAPDSLWLAVPAPGRASVEGDVPRRVIAAKGFGRDSRPNIFPRGRELLFRRRIMHQAVLARNRPAMEASAAHGREPAGGRMDGRSSVSGGGGSGQPRNGPRRLRPGLWREKPSPPKSGT